MSTRLFLLAFLLPSLALGQGLPLKDGDSGTLAEVTTNKALETIEGKSIKATYKVSIGAVAYTVLESLINLEAEAGRGFRIVEVCIQPGSATAAAWVSWQLIRTTTASSAGTVISAESTTTHSVSRFDLGDSTWGGAARSGGTEGTSGAVLDQGVVFVNITATPPAHPGHEFCRTYCQPGGGGKCPIIPASVSNGVKLMFTGTAGGASQAASITFIAE